MPETMTTLSAVQVTPRLTEIIGDGLAKRPIAARIVVASILRDARLMHRPAISAHVAMGNSSISGSGRNARGGPPPGGAGGRRRASWDTRAVRPEIEAAAIAARGAARRSSGNCLLTYVPSPVRPSKYPSACNCSNAITAVPRETAYCFASSRVAGSCTPRFSPESPIGSRHRAIARS
jgi:hypothetical protein